VIAPDSLPDVLRVTATSEDGEIMAVVHRDQPTVGVQFHPESALTEYGYFMLDGFLQGSRVQRGTDRALPDRADGQHATRDSLPDDDPPYGGDPGPALDAAPPPVSVVR
jgi:hypothetical protein